MDQRSKPSSSRALAQESKIWSASAHEMAGTGLHEDVDHRREDLRLAGGEDPRPPLLAAAASGDHVRRERPRRAAEAEDALLRRKGRTKPPQRLVDGGKMGLEVRECQRRGISRRLEPRSFPFHEPDLLPEGVRQDEDVREDDRGVERIAAHRLEGGLHREIGIVAEVEKARRLRPQLTILREVAARLAHEPDGGGVDGLSAEGAHESRRRRGGSVHLSQILELMKDDVVVGPRVTGTSAPHTGTAAIRPCPRKRTPQVFTRSDKPSQGATIVAPAVAGGARSRRGGEVDELCVAAHKVALAANTVRSLAR